MRPHIVLFLLFPVLLEEDFIRNVRVVEYEASYVLIFANSHM